jgi:hypothetical protein
MRPSKNRARCHGVHSNEGRIGSRFSIRSNKDLQFCCILAVLTVCCSWGALGQGQRNPRLESFQRFVNGQLSIKEAVVYRQVHMSETNSFVNEEWWRFGCQPNTWYVQRLHPDPNNPAKFVPLKNDVKFGASFTNMWMVTEKVLDLVEKQSAAGSRPIKNGELHRNLMFGALSLGLPRRLDAFDIADAQIEWDGTAFRTEIKGNNGTNRLALEGRLRLAGDGSPISTEYRAMGTLPAGRVAYEYRTNGMLVPATFTWSSGGMKARYEFLSIEFGTNHAAEERGYTPTLFADLKFERQITLWTNDRPYSLINGRIRPAFGVRVAGQASKATGFAILISIAAGSAIILALSYWRSKKRSK